MHYYIASKNSIVFDSKIQELLDSHRDQTELFEIPNNHSEIPQIFKEKKSGIVIFPAEWEDLFSVKIIEELNKLEEPFETILVGHLPSVSHLIVAYNEGLGAYIETPIDDARFAHTLKRVRKKLDSKRQLAQFKYQVSQKHNSHHILSSSELRNRDHSLGKALLASVKESGPLFKNKIKALLVINSESQKKKLAEVLSAIGLSLDYCASFNDVLERSDLDEFNAIIADRVLPDGEALECAKKLRQLKLSRLPRFIVWSASPEKIGELLEPQSFVDDVLLKPSPDVGIESILPTVIAAVSQTLG